MAHPFIRHINDVLPHIAGKDEFIVAEKEHFTTINYVVVKNDTFDHEDENVRAILHECRGLKFDKDGNLIARPYPKFFNVNEKEDTLAENIDWTKPHIILEKLDGSMVHPLYIGDKDAFRLSTKMGISDTALNAEVWMFQHDHYIKFMRDMHTQNFTPIFEWVSHKDKIVVEYEEENMILTGVRHNTLGSLMTYDDMVLLGQKYNIPVVKHYGSVENSVKFLEDAKNLMNAEGYVVRFFDGHMVKVKAYDYVMRHKSKDIVGSEKDMAQIIFDEKGDDFISMLSKEDREKFENFRSALLEKMADVSIKLFEDAIHVKCDRKEYALKIAEKLHHNSFTKSGIFKIWDNRTIEEATKYVYKYVSTHCGNGTKFEEVKKEVLKW